MAPAKTSWLDTLLGFPAFIGIGGVLWWQWKQVHEWAIRFFLCVEGLLAFPPFPPLLVYALIGAILGISISLFKHDKKWIQGFWRWRALLLPVLLIALIGWLKLPHLLR